MKIFTRFKLIAPILLLGHVAFAQPSLYKMKGRLIDEKNNSSAAEFQIVAKMPSQGSLLLGDDLNVSMKGAAQWLADKLQFRKGVDAVTFVGQPTDYKNLSIQKLQQYYKGIKVEHGIITAVSKGTKLAMLQMEFYSINDGLGITPQIKELTALQKAKDFVGATKYAWEINTGNIADRNIPKGELVIVEDILQEPGKMCLAFKFNIYAENPFSKNRIYVNARTGKIVLKDAIVKDHNLRDKDKGDRLNINNPIIRANQPVFDPANKILANAIGSAETNYSGVQSITTTMVSPNFFVLQETGRGDNTTIRTRNLNHASNESADTALATDYTANDNVWGILEDYPEPSPGVELDAHWAMEKIIDYWWTVHGRKSYDNANAPITNYVHWGNANNNQAQWDEVDRAIRYGDGAGSSATNGKKPFVSLDIIGHEFGHGIAGNTAKFVTGRESGALDEGFGDIWGACVENYVLPVMKNPFLVAEEIEARPGHLSSRSMINPHAENQPDTYKNDSTHYWKDASIEGCPVVSDATDYCGVHSNMGILNKWFYIITHGDTGRNGNKFDFSITGLGFEKTEKIAFATEQILTPNSGFETMMIASFNAAALLNMQADIPTLKDAWKAVGVFADTLYNQANSVFTTNDFKTIGVGKYGCIWAGTANSGLYRYNGLKWEKAPVLTNHNISEIKTDTSGGIWIAQYGKNSANADQGGIEYFADSSFTLKHYSDVNGLPTRSVRSIFINNEQAGVTYPQYRIWAANFSDISVGNTRVGSVGRGKNFNSTLNSEFKKITSMLDMEYGVGTQTIAGNKNEVWAFAPNNFGHSQLLRYNSVTEDSIGRIDETNSILPAGFNAKALYYDTTFQQWWVGLGNGSVYVCHVNGSILTWEQVPAAVFPPGVIINNNAITGDGHGNIYIGSTNGYVVYGSTNSSWANIPANVNLYKRYTKADGLPSLNIKGICVDTLGNRLLLATDSGIVFKYNICKACFVSPVFYSVGPGDWNDPATWGNGKVPSPKSNVVVKHAVTVKSDGSCGSLKVVTQGSITVNAGIRLNIISP